jgi:hypothetical protein
VAVDIHGAALAKVDLGKLLGRLMLHLHTELQEKLAHRFQLTHITATYHDDRIVAVYISCTLDTAGVQVALEHRCHEHGVA